MVEFGVEPADFKVQHKSHVFKIMACAVSGCLVTAGDIEAGGKGYKVAFERCGDFEKAEKTTHKRRYIGGGKWKMDGDISRKEGDLYFVGHEVTGACEGGKTGDKGTRCAVYVEHGSSCVKKKKWCTLKFMRDVPAPEGPRASSACANVSSRRPRAMASRCSRPWTRRRCRATR